MKDLSLGLGHNSKDSGGAKMRVLIVQHGFFPGFVAPIAKELAKNIWKLGVNVEVVTIGKRSPQATDEPLEFPVHYIENTNVFHVYTELRKLLKNVDLVHYLPGKGLELMPLLDRRVKYIFNHISVSVTGNPIRDRIINFVKCLQPLFADLILFTDRELANALWPLRATPTEIMPVGYAPDLFYPCPLYEPKTEKQLVYHGAVRPQRKLDQLVRVLSRLPKDYTLTIIGGGAPADEVYRKYLGEIAKHLNCDDRLNLINMPQVEIRAVIDKAYLCLSYVPMLECFQDQFVLKTLEYLACQRPVLATATRYNKLFRESIGYNRILLSEDTVEDLAEKIVGAEDYVRNFYSPENLRTLPSVLALYSSRHLVKDILLPIYNKVLKLGL